MSAFNCGSSKRVFCGFVSSQLSRFSNLSANSTSFFVHGLKRVKFVMSLTADVVDVLMRSNAVMRAHGYTELCMGFPLRFELIICRTAIIARSLLLPDGCQDADDVWL